MERFFKTKAVFDSEVFKPGIAVKIEGTDWDGDKVDLIGLLKENNGDVLNIVLVDKYEFDLMIEETIGSPEFRKPKEIDPGADFGFKVTILEEPNKEPQEEPKKKGGYKLSEDDIRNIRKLGYYDIPQSEIAGIFNIARSTVSEIINNKIHKDVK